MESHHIIPKSFSLVNASITENQVFLTAKEHFICHHLLTKMFNGPFCSKMWFALLSMCNTNLEYRKIKISARQYEFIKINSMKAREGKKCFNNGKIIKYAFDCPVGFKRGKLITPNNRRTDKKLYTNGSINVYSKTCPQGFWLGKTLTDTNTTKDRKFYTNGIKNKSSLSCPEDGYWLGFTSSKTKWFTNGKENKLLDKCPNDFSLGRTILW